MKKFLLFFLVFGFSATVFSQNFSTNDSTVVIVDGQEAALNYNQGITDFNGGNYALASGDFTKAVDINTKFYQAYYNRGITELKLNLDKQALRDFSTAISYNNKNPEYFLARAIANCRLKNYDEALKAIKKAESMDYNPDKIKYFYGYVYYLRGDYKKAVDTYTEAINKNSKYAYAYCDRAAAHIKTANLKAALDDYNTALEIMPSGYYIYVLRAWSKAYLNNYSGAIADVNTAIEFDKDKSLDYLNERAMIYAYFKKYKLATDDFNTCVSRNPDLPDTYINIGNMYMSQKKYALAEKSFTTALEKDSKNIAAYNNRANAKELQFNLNGAQSDRQIAENLLKQLQQ